MCINLQKNQTYKKDSQMNKKDSFDLDKDFDDDQGFFINKNSIKNDSVGNNSGGVRSQRDSDFDMMDDHYQEKVQHKMELQKQQKQVEQGQIIQIGPQNNPNLGNKSNKQPQISLYDIEVHLSSKTIAILNFKKTLETILQYLNAFQLDELTKFIRLIMDLPSFDETFDKQKRRNQKMQIEKNQLDEISSDLSAKSQSEYKLPSHGIQTIFQIVSFLTDLVDKCSHIDNIHLTPLLKQVLNVQSRFYNLPLRPEQLINQNQQFLQNSNNEQRYQNIEQAFQNSYVSLFQFSDEVNSLKQIWYNYFSLRCINNCFTKDSTNKLTTKMKIHCIRILNQLSQSSNQFFIKFNLNRQQNNYIVSTKTEILKMQKLQLQDYSNAIFDFCHKNPNKIALYLSFLISTLVNDQNSIQKKSLALKLIDKLILNTKIYSDTIDTVSQILEQHQIINYFLKDQTHSQLLRKLSPIVKFLYQLQKIQIGFIKKLIKDSLKGHQQFFKVVQSIFQYLKLKHLQEVFHFIKHISTKQTELLNSHIAGFIQSIVSNTHLASNRKKRKHQNKKQHNQIKNQHDFTEHQIISSANQEDYHLVYEIFEFLFNLIQDPKFENIYINILCKHISLQISLLLPILEQQLTNRLIHPKNYQSFIISLLDYCLKIDMDNAFIDQHEKKKIIQEKQEGTKYQFINNLVVNCNLYDSILVVLCKKRTDRSITQKCLNILVLTTKSYKPLQKGHIQLLWKILGRHSSNQFEKEQFFQFSKEILKNSVNLTEQSVKYIFFEIILKLHYDWFTPKIYDCFEMLFMRLNEDGKLLTYENQNTGNQNSTYHLIKTELVGIEKFYYLYFWADSKVSKKVKDFLFKLYSYKSSAQTKQKLCYEFIQAVMKYLKRNPQRQDRVLFAEKNQDFQQHVVRAFEFFSKFLQVSFKQGEQNSNEQNIITINIQNATRQALPPVKKSIQVNRNMLLKDFKDLIRKEINPQIFEIDLINKGKPLKVDKMSLKQLKIQNKNTILVQNLDVPVPKKQTQQKNLRQCKQMLQGIFGQQHSVELLNYVAQKYLGQQLDKICEWIMDEQKMRQVELQMKAKNSIKIQQQKQIIPQKKYENEQQILSFGQLLSKEIQYLLTLIQVNPSLDKNKEHIYKIKNNIIQKQWIVIKKIPANIQIAKRIQAQLQQQPINYHNIFSINNNKYNSLNINAYKWFLFKRIIKRKSDQFKKLILFEKTLQTFIIDCLQNLIKNQIYNQQLYQEIIETHQSIIQGISNKNDSNVKSASIFSILIEQVKNKSKQSFAPNNVLYEINHIIENTKQEFRKFNFIQYKDKYSTYQKLIKLLTTYSLDQKIAFKLLGFMLFNLTYPDNRQLGQVSQNLSSLLNKDRLYSLILRYKQPFLKFYFALFILDSQKSHNSGPNNLIQIYKQNYQNLRTFIFENQIRVREGQFQQKGTKQWLYFLLIGYIELIDANKCNSLQSQYGTIFENDLLNWIRILMSDYSNLQNNQLIGILALISKLTQKSFENIQHTNITHFLQENFNIFEDFIDFLTKEFIFQLKRVPILTEQVIKRPYYQILLSLSASNRDLLLKICDKIVQFGVQKRNHDHDNIDFKKNQFVGIQNLGCTCYINSLIQQLYHTKLPYKLLSLVKQEGLFEINHTFMQLFMSTKNAINIRPMIQQVKFYGQQIIPNIQQDVEQFLISFLDYLESCNGRAIIDSIFGGSYSQELAYFSQKQDGKIFTKHKQQHFYNITLDIKGKKTLNEALVYFFRSQTLDDKIYCQQIQQKTPVVKRSFIKNFPKILIFTLKRFEFDVENMVRNKLNDYLQFPIDLDLTEYSLDKFLEGQQNKNKILIEKNLNQQSHLYSLCGILIHSGSAEAGHYYSYIQRQNKWYEFNDRIVSEINLSQKIKGECFGGGDSKSRNAYMLFYQKNEKNRKQNVPLTEKIQKMQIQEQQSAMQQQLQKTIPLQEQQQDNYGNHGIFLAQIPASNYFKHLVRDENNHFIRQRLIYDGEYRKFVGLLISKIRQSKERNPYQSELDKRFEYLISMKLQQIDRINQIINPMVERPVVHFVSNEMMQIQELRQVSYEQEQRLNEQKRKKQRQNDIVSDILGQGNDYI